MHKTYWKIAAAGALAGSVNGLFGAGGGMLLVPLLSSLKVFEEREVFPASISIIFPICFVSLFIGALQTKLAWTTALPYLVGSALGGILAGLFGKRIPTVWLHRILGVFILYGGWRYLC